MKNLENMTENLLQDWKAKHWKLGMGGLTEDHTNCMQASDCGGAIRKHLWTDVARINGLTGIPVLWTDSFGLILRARWIVTFFPQTPRDLGEDLNDMSCDSSNRTVLSTKKHPDGGRRAQPKW